MTIRRYILPILGIAAATAAVSGTEPNLPRIEILGREYYYHEVKKGESIYGVANKYDWDLNELVRLNPNTASEMKKGSRLYYPTGKVTVVSEGYEVSDKSNDSVSYEPIRHTVKRGETVYSISRQYNIPLERIYEAYPSAKYGIKAGDTMVFEQTPKSDAGKYLYYVIKPGDTLYSLARTYHTTIEDILKSNPGVSEQNFRIGDTVRIAVDSNMKRIHTELVEEDRLASIESYKVKKNENWGSIAQKQGVDVETLKEANDDKAVLKKNDVVNVPVIETVKVEKEFVETDPREKSEEGIRELYDSVHNTTSGELAAVNVVLLLDNPTSKKDVEFSRGFLTALDGMKQTPYKINFKVIDGRSSTTRVTDALDDFEPNLIVATADKTFPAFLADYGNTNHVEIVNVFDVRSELYEDNPSVVQILPSSAFFNQQIAAYLAETNPSSHLLMVGTPDPGDDIAQHLLQNYRGGDIDKLSVSDLSSYPIEETESYVVYAYPTRKEEVADVMQAVANIKEALPLADVTVVGRPSWVTLVDSFGDRFADNNVVVPSRVWFDEESSEGKKFVSQYSRMYGGTPMKSFPNFAASGYDMANSFIPATASNGGDYNKGMPADTKHGVQSDIRLERVNNWGGFANRVGYILKFRPGGFIDKVMLK